MTDVPILFSAPMVLSLLAGHKVMTRRLAWEQSYQRYVSTSKRKGKFVRCGKEAHGATGPHEFPSRWQRVVPGDRLWVREQVRQHCHFGFPLGPSPQIQIGSNQRVWSYAADNTDPDSITGGFPSIHMPRWASRLTLIVTASKIERLQKISNADAIAEGCGVNFDHPNPSVTREIFPAERFRNLWNRLHGTESWDDNPQVVALTFTVHQENIDVLKVAA